MESLDGTRLAPFWSDCNGLLAAGSFSRAPVQLHAASERERPAGVLAVVVATLPQPFAGAPALRTAATGTFVAARMLQDKFTLVALAIVHAQIEGTRPEGKDARSDGEERRPRPSGAGSYSGRGWISPTLLNSSRSMPCLIPSGPGGLRRASRSAPCAPESKGGLVDA